MVKTPRNRRSSIHAVTLDVAGTLIEVARPVGETYAAVAAEVGGTLDARRLREAFGEVFPKMPALAFPLARPCALAELEKDWWRELVRRMVARSGEVAAFEAFFERLYEHFRHGDAWRVYPEVPEVLETLSAMGCGLAIVSNFDSRLEGVLRDLRLIQHFEPVVYSSVTGAAKPDPIIFQCALRSLHTPAANVLHVGDDRGADYGGARNAGLQALLVERRAATSGGDSIADLSMLPEWVRQSF